MVTSICPQPLPEPPNTYQSLGCFLEYLNEQKLAEKDRYIRVMENDGTNMFIICISQQQAEVFIDAEFLMFDKTWQRIAGNFHELSFVTSKSPLNQSKSSESDWVLLGATRSH